MRVATKKFRHSKRALGATVGLLLGLSLIMMTPAANAISIGGPSDCDDNAIIRCGVHSTAAVKNAYNASAYVRGVYAAFGISNADMANLDNTNVAGRVTKDGNVFIDSQSKAVAGNAVTGGRQNIPGSTKVNANGAIFYQRPPSVSFQQQSLPAFVSMKNGQFQFAVIASCGNAVKATPAKPSTTAVAPAQPVSKPQVKAAPKPAPAPTQSQSQQQQQSQTVSVNNTNTQTINSNQKEAPQQPATKTAQPQPAASTSSQQPAAQQTASQPTSLVNTGPGSLVAAFLVSSLAGALGFRRFLAYKMSKVSADA